MFSTSNQMGTSSFHNRDVNSIEKHQHRVGVAVIDRTAKRLSVERFAERRVLAPTTLDLCVNSHHAILGNFQIVDLEWGSNFTFKHSPIDADYTICVPIASIDSQVDPQPSAIATLVNPSQQFSKILSTAGRYLFIGIARQSIKQMLTKLINRDLKQPLLFDSEIDLSTSFCKSLWQLIELLGRHEDSVTISSPLMQQELVGALLACLLKGVKNNYSDEILYQTQGACAYHVHKACTFIETHLQEEIDLADIAAAVAVSPRLLQKAFAQQYNCSPIRFVTQMRLKAIHQQLQRSAAHTRITDVMMNYGITQGGKFAKEYQQLFGEKPSDTLKRAIQSDWQYPSLWREIDDRRSEKIVGGVVSCSPDSGLPAPSICNLEVWCGYLQTLGIFFTQQFPAATAVPNRIR